MKPRSQQMLLIRRRTHHRVNSGLPNQPGFARGRIHVGQLGRRIVIKQIFIVRAGQQIFVRGRRTRLTQTLLNLGPLRSRSFYRSRATICRDQVRQNRLAVAEPFHRAATTTAPTAARTDAIHHHAVQTPGLPGSRRAQPKFNALRCSIRERKRFAVRAPHRGTQLRFFRQ